MLTTCEAYATYVSRYTSNWKVFEIKSSNNLNDEEFESTIEEYSVNFETSVKAFLNDLQKSSTQNMNTLLSRLDFNAYYMPRILF